MHYVNLNLKEIIVIESVLHIAGIMEQHLLSTLSIYFRPINICDRLRENRAQRG